MIQAAQFWRGQARSEGWENAREVKQDGGIRFWLDDVPRALIEAVDAVLAFEAEQ